MRYGLSLLTSIAWALWFGGTIALFLFVGYLFSTERATAMVAAPRMFLIFERYQLILAAAALLTSAAWRLLVPRGAVTALFTAFALSAVAVVFSATLIRPPMERLREAGQSSGPEFARLHKTSVRVYSAEAIMLLIGGIILHYALTPRPPRETRELDSTREPLETAPGTAAPTTPPA